MEGPSKCPVWRGLAARHPNHTIKLQVLERLIILASFRKIAVTTECYAFIPIDRQIETSSGGELSTAGAPASKAQIAKLRAAPNFRTILANAASRQAVMNRYEWRA
jgi:hypothetical protein